MYILIASLPGRTGLDLRQLVLYSAVLRDERLVLITQQRHLAVEPAQVELLQDARVSRRALLSLYEQRFLFSFH